MFPLEYVHLDKVVVKANILKCVHVQEYKEALLTRYFVRVTFGCKQCEAKRKSFRLCFPTELLMFHMLLKKFKLYLTHQSTKTGYCDHLLLFPSILHDLGRKPRTVDLNDFRLEQSELKLENTTEMFEEVTAEFLPNNVPFATRSTLKILSPVEVKTTALLTARATSGTAKPTCLLRAHKS